MNVNKGDMAIVIKSLNRENLGAIVHVGEFLGYLWGDENCWECHFDRPRPTKSESGLVSMDIKCGIPDAWLRRVSGLDDTESTDEQLIKPVANLVSAD